MQTLNTWWTKYQDVVAASLVLVALVLSVAIMAVVAQGCKREPIVVDVSEQTPIEVDVLPPDTHFPTASDVTELQEATQTDE